MTLISKRQILDIEVNQIDPNPYQPRRHFDTDILLKLSESIKEHGMMQPISVRLLDSGRYELIAGERRLRASKMANLDHVPAVILNVSDEESTILALIENLQRENLNFMEEAEGYFNLIHDYQLKQEDVAKQVGKSQSTIANKLRLLNLSEGVVQVIFDNNLSERHARALLILKTEADQLTILDQVVKKDLNVKKTEALIKKFLEGPQKEQEIQIKHSLKDIRIFTNTIKQAVEMMKEAGVDADYKIEQDDEAYQITINIPIEQ